MPAARPLEATSAHRAPREPISLLTHHIAGSWTKRPAPSRPCRSMGQTPRVTADGVQVFQTFVRAPFHDHQPDRRYPRKGWVNAASRRNLSRDGDHGTMCLTDVRSNLPPWRRFNLAGCAGTPSLLVAYLPSAGQRPEAGAFTDLLTAPPHYCHGQPRSYEVVEVKHRSEFHARGNGLICCLSN